MFSFWPWPWGIKQTRDSNRSLTKHILPQRTLVNTEPSNETKEQPEVDRSIFHLQIAPAQQNVCSLFSDGCLSPMRNVHVHWQKWVSPSQGKISPSNEGQHVALFIPQKNHEFCSPSLLHLFTNSTFIPKSLPHEIGSSERQNPKERQRERERNLLWTLEKCCIIPLELLKNQWTESTSVEWLVWTEQSLHTNWEGACTNNIWPWTVAQSVGWIVFCSVCDWNSCFGCLSVWAGMPHRAL